MADDFNGAAEPMRAIRDLINACETVFGPDEYEQGVLTRAQAGFTALRAMHGDTRPGDQIADAQMREPNIPLHSAADDMLRALKETTRCAALPEAWLTPIRKAITKAEA